MLHLPRVVRRVSGLAADQQRVNRGDEEARQHEPLLRETGGGEIDARGAVAQQLAHQHLLDPQIHGHEQPRADEWRGLAQKLLRCRAAEAPLQDASPACLIGPGESRGGQREIESEGGGEPGQWGVHLD